MSPRANQGLQLPLIRLNLAQPFLEAAAHTGADVAPVIAEVGLSTTDFDNSDKFVTAPVMYDTVEALAELTGDPYTGYRLGSELDPFSWSPLADAARKAHSVGDLLLRFSIDAYRDASSVVFSLNTQGDRTTFTEARLYSGRRMPRHNDAFGVAYILKILHSAMESHWHGSQVLVSVCDPKVIPSEHLGVRVAKTGNDGFSLAFPSAWLLLKPALQQSDTKPSERLTSQAPSTSLPALRVLMAEHLHENALNTSRVAELCDMSKRTLARRLAELDTSVKAELDTLRRKAAEAALVTGQESITDIGRSIGYPDPSVFTRAFKRWTGLTPRAYRDNYVTTGDCHDEH